MTNSKKMDSCWEMSETMEILPFSSQYIFSLLLYMVYNQHLFIKNLEVHNHDTTSANSFHLPITNLTKYRKGAQYAGIKIFIHLPTHIKCAANEVHVFKSAWKSVLLFHFSLLRNILINNIYYRLLCFNVIINIFYVIIVLWEAADK